MNRPVKGADGRQWTLRSELEWRTPVTADDFEHDVSGGYVPAALMIAIITVFVIVLVAWRPTDVIVPGWVLLTLALVVLFFPLRWVLRRPWKVVAETEGDPEQEKPSERWVGTVRGMIKVRTEMSRTRQSIERVSLPDFEGPLRPVE
ncbi:MAG: DUF983 domain-containing protein [Actinophytocola sp.]|nr:DUF983 domain-containing protein [Actinophytocola sp.]